MRRVNTINRIALFVSVIYITMGGSAWAQTPIDFSHAGYGGGGVVIPAVQALITVRPTGGDDTALLQSAIDRVASMPLTGTGFRGAVLLQAGRYRVSGTLQLRASGVVLRGNPNTTIIATGRSRRTLIDIGNTAEVVTGPSIRVTDDMVAAGARSFSLENVAGLHPGDHMIVTRPSTMPWIAALKMNGNPGSFANQRIDWTPGSRNLVWDRTVVSIDSALKRVTVDAPITTALESRYGGGTVALVTGGRPIENVGVENLTLDSEFAAGSPRDEEHSWIAVALDRVEDAWVRDVTARHFAGSAVRAGLHARRVTIKFCHSEAPVSEPAGYRRQSFLIEGQQVLVLQSSSSEGMNDFAAGALAAGPNVFLDSEATSALGASGTFESWASGVLYEDIRVQGAGIWLTNDKPRAQGGGWTAANSVVWNSDDADIQVHGPDGAENIVMRAADPLYQTQLLRRTGFGLPVDVPPRKPITAVPEFRLSKSAAPAPAAHSAAITIVNGRFVADGKVVWGGTVNDGWWRGQALSGSALDLGGVALTRWVPGRNGPGLTEDLAALASRMIRQGTPFFQSIPGLWYDRRRDEHTTFSRADANVWAPFYEMPWARSGKGTASDGLSLFDLNSFNPWYYGRLHEFGDLSDRFGIVFYHNLYNTHNLLEILPHWVDYPWRAVNNVNGTGLPEPPPIEGTNNIHVANDVYDITNPVRRALHRAFILHELDELAGVKNIFFSLGAQFSGPLAFQEFFQDTVGEWEKKNNRTVRIELATSRDITDAILANPVRSRQVAVINMQYWQYRPDGTAWAPQGGRNLAFREMIGKDFGRTDDTPPNTTPLQVYRQVREYRDKYPDKAIVSWNGGAGPVPVLMAGGSQVLMLNPSAGHGQGKSIDRTPLDAFVRDHLSSRLMNMKPRDGAVGEPDQNWCLADDRRESVLLYSFSGASIRLINALPRNGYTGLWFDPKTGNTKTLDAVVSTTAGAVLTKPTSDPWLLLLTAVR